MAKLEEANDLAGRINRIMRTLEILKIKGEDRDLCLNAVILFNQQQPEYSKVMAFTVDLLETKLARLKKEFAEL